jgi:hypothetical protein
VDVKALVIRYVMYVAMGALVLAALVGVLEGDAVEEAQGASSRIEVAWPEVTRQGLKPDLRVTYTNLGDRPATPRLALEPGYLNVLQLDGVHPHPVEVVPVAGGLIEHRFEALEPGATLDAWLTFSIDHQSQRFRARGRLQAALGADMPVDREISTLVLP